METKLVRIAEISATSKHPIFTSVYHLINEDMLKQCHKELDGNKAVGIDKVTKDEYGKNLDRNIKELVQRLKNKSFERKTNWTLSVLWCYMEFSEDNNILA